MHIDLSVRQGAGKSSLILTLLRIVNFEGTITIDGYASTQTEEQNTSLTKN